MKLKKQASKDDFQIELQQSKKQPMIEIQDASAFMTNVSAMDDSTVAGSDEKMMLSEGQPDIASSTVEEELEDDDQLSESEQSMRPPVQQNDVQDFKPAEEKKYMTAADFERVCQQLQAISSSYDKSAQRYEKAIEVTEKTIKTCQRAE